MQLYGIDLNLLVAFDALMVERNVTRAGQRIGRTQPAMSAALSRLRALLRDELFVRGPEGLQPTSRALDLAEPLSLALNQIQSALLFAQDFDARVSNAIIILGISEHPARALLPRLLCHLRKDAPGIDLRILQVDDPDRTLEMLDNGEIDVAITHPLREHSRILSRPLYEEELVCIVRKGHYITGGELTAQNFASLDHLLVADEQRYCRHLDEMLGRCGLRRRAGIIIPQLYLAPPIVACSDFVATVMSGVVDCSGYQTEVCEIPPPFRLPAIPFLMSWHRRNDMHPAQRWLRTLVATNLPIAKRAPDEIPA